LITKAFVNRFGSTFCADEEAQRGSMPPRRSPSTDRGLEERLDALARATRRLRRARGWTLEEAAEAADLDVRHLQQLESGGANPTVGTLLRVARGLGVEIGALFADGNAVDDGAPQRTASQEIASSGPATRGVRPSLAPPTPQEAVRCEERPVERFDAGSMGQPPVSSDEALAHRVRALRQGRGWSQADLARRADVSQGAVQGLEARTKSPTLRTLDAVARALGVAPHALLLPLPTTLRSREE
jgi:transcriptional regulator with XRE-family HTH domain